MESESSIAVFSGTNGFSIFSKEHGTSIFSSGNSVHISSKIGDVRVNGRKVIFADENKNEDSNNEYSKLWNIEHKDKNEEISRVVATDGSQLKFHK